jgi:hypothetical protein
MAAKFLHDEEQPCQSKLQVEEGWFTVAMPLEAVQRQEVGGDLKGQSGDFGSSNHGEKISDFNEDSNKDKESSGDYGQNKTCFTKQNPRDDCAHIVREESSVNSV